MITHGCVNPSTHSGRLTPTALCDLLAAIEVQRVLSLRKVSKTYQVRTYAQVAGLGLEVFVFTSLHLALRGHTTYEVPGWPLYTFLAQLVTSC
jgi:hypothetical protein